jgi:hypothetical protein
MFLGLSLVVPILGALLAAALTSMTYNVRYVAMVFPAFCLILAAGLSVLLKPALQILLVIGILLANSYSLANYYFNSRYAREDTRSAAQYLESVTRAQDVILIVGSQNGLRYYYKGGLPVLWWGRREVIDNRLVTTKLLNDLQHEYDRLWLVSVRPWERDPKGKLKALLEELYPGTAEKQFAGVGVYCYQLAQPDPP